jgi:uncharacterized protein (DUF1800 family)
LGQRVPGRGQQQGEWALDQLARHPSTARHLATKLALYFVSDAPPADPAADFFAKMRARFDDKKK